jgi:2',3'-cyclic-nucleotide 2'-phosphodiesterase (5'-nucleotidase family)
MRTTYAADFAITNSGGLVSSLTCPATDNPSDFCPAYTPPPYPITRGQVLSVLPFGNEVVTVQVNGAELAMLENGVPECRRSGDSTVSGCSTTFHPAKPGDRGRSQMADGSCTGAAVDLTAAAGYNLAINDLSTGGDGYPDVYGRSTTRDYMDQVLADYITANTPISPAIQGRITCTTSGATPCPVTLP